MSKYTTEVRFICENNAGLTENKGYKDIKNILTTAAPKIFDFDFPIFDEQYRLPLEIKILRHYYTREICEETVGLWKLRLEDRLNVIMPYYNQMYKSELIKFNPMYDVDLIRDHKTENNGESNNTSNRAMHSESSDTTDGTRNDAGHSVRKGSSDTTNESNYNNTTDTTGSNNTSESGTITKNGTAWKLYSDTPQGGVDGIRHADDDVENMAYLTNATKDTTNENTTTSGKAEGTNTSKQTNTGNNNGTVNVATNDDETNTVDSKTHSTSNGQTDGTDTFTGKNTVTSTEDYLEHVRGKQGVTSYSRLLKEFRETFLNIDALVIDELNDLFFGLW